MCDRVGRPVPNAPGGDEAVGRAARVRGAVPSPVGVHDRRCGSTAPRRFRSFVIMASAARKGRGSAHGAQPSHAVPPGGPWDDQDCRDRAVVRLLVERSVDDPLAPFALHPEKRFVFSADGKAVIGYAVRLGVAVASGDPVGAPESWPGAVDALVGLARREQWRVAVLAAGERARPLWAAHGLRAIPIGRDVVVRTHEWRLEGRRFRNLRQAIQRTHNAGVTVDLLPEGTVLPVIVEEVRGLWSGAHRNDRRGFAMNLGRWFDGGRPDSLMALARDRTGRLVAAQRYLWAGTRDLSLDVPLRAPDAPNGVDERLVAEMVAWAACHGVERVSLSFAPFPDLYAAPTGVAARAAALALHALDPVIRVRRLYRYLRKFHAFDQQRFVMLRLRHALVVGVVLLLLEFGPRLRRGAVRPGR